MQILASECNRLPCDYADTQDGEYNTVVANYTRYPVAKHTAVRRLPENKEDVCPCKTHARANQFIRMCHAKSGPTAENSVLVRFSWPIAKLRVNCSFASSTILVLAGRSATWRNIRGCLDASLRSSLTSMLNSRILRVLAPRVPIATAARTFTAVASRCHLGPLTATTICSRAQRSSMPALAAPCRAMSLTATTVTPSPTQSAGLLLTPPFRWFSKPLSGTTTDACVHSMLDYVRLFCVICSFN